MSIPSQHSRAPSSHSANNKSRMSSERGHDNKSKAASVKAASEMPEEELKGTVVVYSIIACPFCLRAKALLKELNIPYHEIRFDLHPQMREIVTAKTGVKTVPQIYFNEVFIGGSTDLQALVDDKPRFKQMLDKVRNNPMPEDSGVPMLTGSMLSDAEAANDPFSFQATPPDEYYEMLKVLEKDGAVYTTGGWIRPKRKVLTGRKIMNWVIEKQKESEKRGNEIGQALLDRKLIKPSKKKGSLDFSVNGVYHLVEGDITDALNSGKVPSTTPLAANLVGETIRKMALGLFAKFLSADGRAVDYAGIKKSDEFQKYKAFTKELIRVDLLKSTREQKVAFFINVYNSLVIHANVEKGPPTNLLQRWKFFNRTSYIIGGLKYNLQDIENGVLRSNRKGVGQLTKPFGKNDPRLKIALEKCEPLVHFGLVCGAKSCPPIRTYSGDKVTQELKLAAESFLEGKEQCFVDLEHNQVKLSSIFSWYHIDFGKTDLEMLKFLLDLMGPGEKKDQLQTLVNKGSFKVSYFKYDWSVNSKK